MELFMIVICDNNNNKKVIQSLYRTLVSTSYDTGDAICCKTLEDAEALRRLVIDRTEAKADNVKILKSVTTEELI